MQETHREDQPAPQREQVIADLLREIRTSESTYTVSDFHAPWSYYNPPSQVRGGFHFILEGDCWVQRKSGEFIPLSAGDFVFLPFLYGHQIKDHPASSDSLQDSMTLKKTGIFSFCMTKARGGKRAKLICGGVELKPRWHPLIQELPDLLRLTPEQPTAEPWAGIILRLLDQANRGGEIGSTAVADRLTELLVLEVIRKWLRDECSRRSTGWISAFHCSRLGRSIGLIHSQPGKNWTVDALAKAASMSRAAFASEFPQRMGMTPMNYLLSVRMNLARDRIKSGKSQGWISRELGYSSEGSFRRAFKRYWGFTPGSLKREDTGN
ncbi:MAG: AraC family transcriptional regulator [Planctomycetota bacterium]|nr:MAG: AraC family transcriptional regulator [Planctomycetota bacterium]